MIDLHDHETRVTDGATGGQKGKKLTQLGAMDPVALVLLARVAGMGADKYAAFNYLKGYDWSLSYNAMMRHAMLFWAGEDVDPESGLPHMAHAAWMALSLVSFLSRGIGNDNRPPPFRSDVVVPTESQELREVLRQLRDVCPEAITPDGYALIGDLPPPVLFGGEPLVGVVTDLMRGETNVAASELE